MKKEAFDLRTIRSTITIALLSLSIYRDQCCKSKTILACKYMRHIRFLHLAAHLTTPFLSQVRYPPQTRIITIKTHPWALQAYLRKKTLHLLPFEPPYSIYPPALPPSIQANHLLPKNKAVPPPNPSFVLRTSDLARLRVVYQCTSSFVPLSVHVHLESPPPLLPLRDFEFLDWKLEELPILYRSKG